MSARPQIYPQDDDPLCCCEYRNRRGERAHVLQCCCACDEVDQAADSLIRGQAVSRDHLDEILSEIDDRLRLPLPGGAWHIGVPGAVPWVVLPMILLIGAVSARGLLLATLALLPTLYFFHRRALKLRRRSTLLFSWMLASLAFEASLYAAVTRGVAPTSTAQATFGVPLLMTLTLAGVLKRLDPVALRGDIADSDSACGRSVRCPVCSVQVPRYDHYCSWVDEPIGAANHRAYLCFVLAMMITCGVGAGQLLSYELRRWCTWRRILLSNESSLILPFAFYGAAAAIAVAALLLHQLALLVSGRTAYEARRDWRRREAEVRASTDSTSSTHRSLGTWREHLDDFRRQTAPILASATVTALLRGRPEDPRKQDAD